MKNDTSKRGASPDIHLIRDNRRAELMSPVVREFAELLAEIAIRQLRAQEHIAQGDSPHV